MNKGLEIIKKNKINFIISVIVIVLVITLILPSNKRKDDIFKNQSKIQSICNFNTYKAIYHNVGYDDNAGKTFLGLGYKKVWVEYDGEIIVGLDCSKVYAEKTKDGKVIVHIPHAKVNKDSGEDIKNINVRTENGLFTNISAKDKEKVRADAQKNMIETAMKDEELLKMAENRAEKLIENLILKFGEEKGEKYTVSFQYIEDSKK